MDDRTAPLDRPLAGADEPATAAAVAVVCEAGPAAGVTRSLGPGRYVIGRAVSAAFRVADQAIEPHHAVLDVDSAGHVRVHQLAGRVPCRVDGAPVGTDAAGTAVAPGAIITVGASRLRVELDRPQAAPDAREPGSPDPVPDAGDLGHVTVPSEQATRTGARPVWAIGLRRRRDDRAVTEARRRAQLVELERDLAARRTRWLRARRLRAPGIAVVAARLEDQSDEVRGSNVSDTSFVVSLGEGPDRWEPTPVTEDGAPASTGALAVLGRLAAIERAPVECDLGAGATLTISGPGAAGVARAAIIQLAASAGPGQLRLDVGGLAGSSWLGDLPHALAPPSAVGRHVVVFVDRADLVARPPGAIREALELDRDAALVAVDERGLAGRWDVGARLDLGELGIGRWRPDAATVGARELAPAGIDAETARSLAASIASRAAPEPGLPSPRCPRRRAP